MEKNKVIIYTIQNCGYCLKLKELLKENNIEFNEIDGDLPENDDKFSALYKVTNSYNVPTVIVKNSVLVPEISFKTIDDGIKLILKILNEE